MKLAVSDAIRATVLYADIFNWPLKQKELTEWAIKHDMRSIVRAPRGIERTPEGYYVVKGNRHVVARRKKREQWSGEKWRIARRVGTWLRLIPSIQLVGVTGGLSRNNAADEDDIDLFCITAPKSIWITRMMAICIVSFLGLRRRPGEREVRNKICLNMFMSEDAVKVQKDEQDLFTAYEVLQMVPLWERERAYKKFLSTNRWVSNFLPNAWERRQQGSVGTKYGLGSVSRIFLPILYFVEPVARSVQLWYMNKRRTSEVIRQGVLRFHPRDARIWVREAFAMRLARHNLPLDKIFYGR